MSKLPVIVLVAALASAAGALPAFAQAFDPDAGSGNIVPFTAGPPGLSQPSFVAQPNIMAEPRVVAHPRVAARPRRSSGAADRQSGLHSFALVPGNFSGGASAGSYDPLLTGGGSAGYNQLLQTY